MATHIPENILGFEEEYLTAAQEKGLLNRADRTAQRPNNRMFPTYHMLVTLLVCMLVTLGMASAMTPKPWSREPHHGEPGQSHGQAAEGDESSFRALLNSASQESLHELLHKHFPDRFKHGVYPSEQSAMEVVHRADAALATSLVHLAKRGNTTTTTTTSTPDPPTTIITPTLPPPTTTADNQPPPPPPTSDNLPPNSPTSPDTQPPGTTMNTPPSETTSQHRSSRPVTYTFTSTANGTPTVVVQTSYVGVDPEEPTKTRATGSLQSNGAVARNRGVVVEAVLGALVGGVMLV